MKIKKIKLGIIFDQVINTGGGFQYALNSAFLAKKSSQHFSPVFFTIYPENLKLLKEYGIEAKYIKLNVIDRALLKIRYLISNNVFSNHILKYIGVNKFERYLLESKIDLVYFLSPSNWSNYLDNLNFIITVWDLCHRDHPEFPEVYKNRIFERREIEINKFLKKSIAVIVDSKLGKENIIKRYLIDSTRIHILPFSPSRNIINYKNNSNLNIKEKFKINGDYIFYPAQFWAHKNHNYILRGLEILKKRYDIDLNVVFVGKDAGNLDVVKNTARELNLLDKVYFLGFVDSEDMIMLYKNSLALVMPTYFGPTNIPPLEAFTLGVPVLYSDLPGLRDQVGNAALLMDLKDPSSMSKNIVDLINKEGLREKLIRLGKNKIETNNIHNEIIDLICSDYNTKMQCWKND